MILLTRFVLVVSLLSLPFKAAVPQESEPIAEVWPGFGYIKAEQYLKFSPNEQSIYAAGLVDGMYLAPVFDAPNKDKYLTAMRNCTKPMTATNCSDHCEICKRTPREVGQGCEHCCLAGFENSL